MLAASDRSEAHLWILCVRWPFKRRGKRGRDALGSSKPHLIRTHMSRSRPGRPDPLMTPQEFADESRQSLRQVRRIIAAGEIEIIRLGPRAIRIRRSAFEAYLRRRQCRH